MLDFGLYGKHILNQRVGLDAFSESVDIRFQEACKRMNLPTDCIRIKCFASVEKESFMIQDNNSIKVYIDKHQMDSLYMLTFLFYIYGQIDIKYAAYSLMIENIPYFDLRLSFSLLVLQSEKSFCAKRLVQAQAYLDAAEAQDYASCFESLQQADSPMKDLVLSLILLKGRRQDISYSFSLNFFVFHELAHAKYSLAENELDNVAAAVMKLLCCERSIIDVLESNSETEYPKIPIEEYVCDTYALYLLFDFIYEHQSDYEIEFMVDSYFVSVLNIALINSKESNSTLLSEKDYAYAGIRAVKVLSALRILWADEGRPLSLLTSVEQAMKYSFDRFKNLKLSLDNKWEYLYHIHHLEEPESLSTDEENDMITDMLQRLSNVS